MSWDQNLTQQFFFSSPFSFLSSFNQDMCVLQVQGADRVMGQASPHSEFILSAVKGLNVISLRPLLR